MWAWRCWIVEFRDVPMTKCFRRWWYYPNVQTSMVVFALAFHLYFVNLLHTIHTGKDRISLSSSRRLLYSYNFVTYCCIASSVPNILPTSYRRSIAAFVTGQLMFPRSCRNFVS